MWKLRHVQGPRGAQGHAAGLPGLADGGIYKVPRRSAAIRQVGLLLRALPGRRQ